MNDMTQEIWKTIEEYPNYEVSNYGNIRHKRIKQNRKPQDNGKGYLYVAVRDGNKQKHLYVHQTVAKAFIPNPNNLPQASHLDENRQNNRADNLAWATAKENCNMPLHRKRQIYFRGTACVCVETGIVYPSAREAARQLNLSQTAISMCCRGGCQHYKKQHWRYATEEETEAMYKEWLGKEDGVL